jgi:hypothetical protein
LLLLALLLSGVLPGCKRQEQPPVTLPDPPPAQEPQIPADIGLEFSASERYQPTRALSALPLSIEATVAVPTGAEGRRGVIFGNEDGHAAGLSLEIGENGHPALHLRDVAGDTYTCLFDAVDVRGDAVRLSIVWDVAASAVHCYADGALKQTYAGSLPAAPYLPTQCFAVGGDLSRGGTDYFRDVLQGLAVWSDVRTPDEVASAEYDTADAALLLAYDFADAQGDLLCDLSANENDLVCEPLWMDSLRELESFAYSFAVIGDQSGMVGLHSDRLSMTYDWLLNNQASQKIKHVFLLGGLTAGDSAAEWSLAGDQLDRLNGQISYTAVRGEQDSAEKMNAALGADYAISLQGVMVAGDVTNAYRKITVGGHRYLILMLDVGAPDAVLAWASDVIAANRDHRVIVTTHIYQYRDGTTLDSGDAAPATGYVTGGNNGDAIFEKLISKHENIVLVLSSHDPWQGLVCSQVQGDAGNTVTQIMVAPQGLDAHVGATGMVAMLYFSSDGNAIAVRYYSTVRGQYGSDTSHFVLDLTPDTEEG